MKKRTYEITELSEDLQKEHAERLRQADPESCKDATDEELIEYIKESGFRFNKDGSIA